MANFLFFNTEDNRLATGCCSPGHKDDSTLKLKEVEQKCIKNTVLLQKPEDNKQSVDIGKFSDYTETWETEFMKISECLVTFDLYSEGNITLP